MSDKKDLLAAAADKLASSASSAPVSSLSFGALARKQVQEHQSQYTQLPDRVDCVEIDILAAMKIVKHCQDGLLQKEGGLVSGYLFGICSQRYNDGRNILEVSYTAPQDIDEKRNAEIKNLLDTANIDNVNVGWYQSNHLGQIYTPNTAADQYNYQIDHTTPHSVYIIFDPFQSKQGTFVMKAFRLSEKYMAHMARNLNEYFPSNEVYDEVPMHIMSTGLSSMYIKGIADTHPSKFDSNFEALSMSSNDKRIEQQLVRLYENIEYTEHEQSKLIRYVQYQFRNQTRINYFKWIMNRERENLKEGKPIGQGINLHESVCRIKAPECTNASRKVERVETSLALAHLDHCVVQIQDMVNSNLKNLVINKEIQKGI